MGTRRGLLAGVFALVLVPVVAVGCGECSKSPPIDVMWSGKVVLSADSPAAARVIKVDIPPSARLMEVRLDLSWIEKGNNSRELPWVTLIDIDGGKSEFATSWEDPFHGHLSTPVFTAVLTDDCKYGCKRSYALVFRWGSPVAGATRAIDVGADLNIYHAGGADECAGVVGTIDATVSEDLSQRFDGKPRMVSARAVGDLRVPLATETAGGLVAYLHASKELTAPQAVYPTVARVFAGFAPDYSGRSGVIVGSTPQLGDWGDPAQTEWEPLCASDADCTLPIEVTGSFDRRTTASTARWWVEVRIELFSATGTLPDGTLTLTQP